MDNPGISLFQGADININNSQNNEEEEDLEDQIRRKEELQNLLQANLDDFNYDDSTINSPTNMSVASAENFDQNYKNAITPNEQLRVLYDVRCREIQSLKQEYENFKQEKTKEIESLKHQNVLFEAELRQLKISLSNVESLLVEKTESNNKLNSALQMKDAKLHSFERTIKEYEMDISTYKSEITDLQLKLQSQNGPFNLNAKYNSEEFQKSLQDKITRLENVFEEETRKSELCNKEKQVLQEEIQRLVVEKEDLEKENSVILKNFDDAQQQCKDLIDVIEMLKKENEHFKGRLHQLEENREESLDGHKSKSMDSVTFTGHNEKLKKMLVDKSVEVDSLNSKLRFYERDLKELAEYRQLKCDVYKKEFKTCNNQTHTKDLIVMQNEMQNYRRIIDDKNQQILNLNSNNKDLKEKIEEMLLQTRNEIQNISFKYNVPKLEAMSKELEKAENTVKVLSEKLEESEERRLSLLKKLKHKNEENDTAALIEELEKCKKELKEAKMQLRNEQDQNTEIFKELEQHKNEALRLKNQVEELKIERRKSKAEKQSPSKTEDADNVKKEYELLKNQLVQVMEHLEKTSSNNSSRRDTPELVLEIKNQMDQFLGSRQEENIEKGILEEKITSWKKLLNQIENKDPDETLKTQYKEAVMNLHTANEKVKELDDSVQDLKNALTISEGEKCSLTVELKEHVKKLNASENLVKQLESELKELKTIVEKKERELKQREMLGQGDGVDKDDNVTENLRKELDSKENDLRNMEESLKKSEEENEEMKKWIEIMKLEIDRLNVENSKLWTKIKEIHERYPNLSGRDEDKLEKKEQSTPVVETPEFKTMLEEEVMKAEIKLRDEIQIECQKRISNIEKRYQKSCQERNELCKQQKKEIKEQDEKFREYLKMVLTECENSTRKLENEKLELVGQLQLLRTEYDKYKNSMIENEEKYNQLVKKLEKESQKTVEAWRYWSKNVVSNCLDIEATNKKVRDKVLTNLQTYDQEVAALQKMYDARIEKKMSKKEKM